jgi:hypothetical protein
VPLFSSLACLLLLPYVFCYLQTKEGKDAMGLTSMEFEDVMQEIRLDAEKKLAPHLKAAGKDTGDIRYSWDNDRIHQGADLMSVGIADDMRLELPELSSDMHKVIEHVHAQIQYHFDNWLWEFREGKPTVDMCKAKVQEIFMGVEGRKEPLITRDAIKSNVNSLHDTYRAIIGVNGGYPAKKFR